MLDYIKTNVSEQLDQNEATAAKIRGLLKDYKTKLNDLDMALKEAKVLVQKANTQNSLNSQTLKDLQVNKTAVNLLRGTYMLAVCSSASKYNSIYIYIY